MDYFLTLHKDISFIALKCYVICQGKHTTRRHYYYYLLTLIAQQVERGKTLRGIKGCGFNPELAWFILTLKFIIQNNLKNVEAKFRLQIRMKNCQYVVLKLNCFTSHIFEPVYVR